MSNQKCKTINKIIKTPIKKVKTSVEVFKIVKGDLKGTYLLKSDRIFVFTLK